MTRLLVSLCALTISVATARAGEVAGTEAAFGVCESLNFESGKQSCLRIVRNKFFDGRAVRLCAALSFDSEKTECLTAIAGREFTSETEIAMCSKKHFASDTLGCLREAGANERPLVLAAPPVVMPPLTHPVDTKDVRDTITEAISQLENNRPFNASRVLQSLLRRLPK